MSVSIITGYTGERHITPYMDAAANRGVFGNSDCVLAADGQLAASMPTINQFVLQSGVVSIQGHLAQSTGETLAVDTCATGYTRMDLVVARFTHNEISLIDNVEILLIKGTETTSQYPTQPATYSGSIAAGASTVDAILYRINCNGPTVTFSRVAPVDNPLSNITNVVYPVGSIYMSVNNVNPSTLFGGTWVAWGSGRVPVGINASDSNFNSVEKKGGSSTVTLVTGNLPAHAHTYAHSNANTNATTLTVAQMPAHKHKLVKWKKGTEIDAVDVAFYDSTAYGGKNWEVLSGGNTGQTYDAGTKAVGGNQGHTHGIGTYNANTANTGSNQAHNNLQPYITCYMWKRTA